MADRAGELIMRLGVVVQTRADDHSVDLVMTDDGARMTGIQVMTPNGSSRSGVVDLPEVKPAGDKWDITKRHKEKLDLLAVVDYVGRIPVVVGFLYPQINQMLFDDPKIRLDRHQSDVYSMIDGDGNIELKHPSGTYIRLGETPDSKDISTKNVDSSLSVDRNTGRKVYLRVELAGNVAKLTMTPEGECTLELEKSFNLIAKENINMEAEGNISIKAGGTIDTESGGNTTIKAPQITADTQLLDVTGAVNVAEGVTAGGDVLAGSISLQNHTTSAVTPGGGVSGPPI